MVVYGAELVIKKDSMELVIKEEGSIFGILGRICTHGCVHFVVTGDLQPSDSGEFSQVHTTHSPPKSKI